MNALPLHIVGLGLLMTQTLTQAAPSLHGGLTAPSAIATTCQVLTPELAQGTYEGPCLEGLAHGQGVVRWHRAGKEPDPAYIGGFERGHRSGHGQMRYPNGDLYTGQWRDDERTGLGEYRFGPQSPWAGDRYNGHWRANRFHGQGRYTWAMGDAYDGPWQSGQQMGPATAAQARRQAYMAALLPQLPTTGYHVCALRTAPGRPPSRPRCVPCSKTGYSSKPTPPNPSPGNLRPTGVPAPPNPHCIEPPGSAADLSTFKAFHDQLR